MKNFSLIFPGQGFYYKNNMKFFFKKYSIIKDIFEKASDLLKYNFFKNELSEEEKEKKRKKYICYYILISSVAKYKLWKKKTQLHPKILAGHSLGQYTALVCNKNITFKDALYILKKRNKIIKNKTQNISILTIIVIDLKSQIIEKICQENSNRLCYANIISFNSKNQTVISGHYDAVLKVWKCCKIYGAKKIFKLPIYSGLHSNLMKSEIQKYSFFLKKIKIFKGIYPILNNTNAKILKNKKDIYTSLIEQLFKPVQWRNVINYMIKKGISNIIEIGPEKTLTNKTFFNKNITYQSTDSIKNFLHSINLVKK